MKSQERHELKTNLLADWLINFPQWAEQNIRTIIYVAVVLVLVIAAYIWKVYEKDTVEVQKQIEFTKTLGQLNYAKLQILEAQSQGRDMSYVLLQPQKDLEIAAQNAKNNDMSALALIKNGDAIRTDLHCRQGNVDAEEMKSEIDKAKAKYTQAITKAANDPALLAQAKFGLAISEEELGNFEAASKAYAEIVADDTLAGTTAASAAKLRLSAMSDYETKITFKAASPQEAPAAAAQAVQPQIQLPAIEANKPVK